MKSDANFISGVLGSQAFVMKVASWLKNSGRDVLVKPVIVRPDFESRNDYADDGDIEIRLRVEVKHRELDFTSVDDYPYPTVFVDEVYKIDRIPFGNLWGYVIGNRAGTHVCCINPQTRTKWGVEEKYDKKDGQMRSFYTCPKEMCDYRAII